MAIAHFNIYSTNMKFRVKISKLLFYFYYFFIIILYGCDSYDYLLTIIT